MDILYSLIIGFIVGALAKLVMPGRDPGGILVTMGLGMVGAVLAGFVGRALGWYASGESPGLIASVIGAIAVLLIYRTTRRRTRMRP